MMSLNAIYAAAGSPANKEPWRWLDTEAARQFIDSVMEILHLDRSLLIKTSRGRCDRGGGTCAHKEVAQGYLEYIKKGLFKKDKFNGLYALMFSNGIIKVGKSARVAARVNEHEANARAYGLVIIDRYLVEDTETTENELLSFCRGLASQTDEGLNHHGEYFVGINFDKVKSFLGWINVSKKRKSKVKNLDSNGELQLMVLSQ